MEENMPQNDFEEMDFEELENLFGQEDTELAKAQRIVLTQNLDGFANCFPDWDLHPPVGKRKY